MKKCLALAMVAIMLLCLIPTISVFAAKEETLSTLTLNVTAPVEGEKPAYNKIDGRGYYSDNGLQGTSTRIFKNGIAWFKSTTSYFSPGTTETFKGTTSYTVKINLLPKGNFAFASNITAKVNGNTAHIETYDDGSILVTATLTSAKKDVIIDQLSLNVTAPEDGAKPSYTKIDGTGYFSDNGLHGTSTKIYKNGIAWFKSATSYISPGTTETFKGGTDYTVKIALSAKKGYKFSNSLTAKINGKAATVEILGDLDINVSVKLTALKKDHKHTNSGWKSDKTNHWKVCTDKTCSSITVAKEAHKDTNKDSKCDVCAYNIAKNTPAPESETSSTPESTNSSAENPDNTTSQPTQENDGAVDKIEDTTTESDTITTGPKDENTEENNNILIFVIIGAAVVLIAGIITAIVIFKKKKQTK